MVLYLVKHIDALHYKLELSLFVLCLFEPSLTGVLLLYHTRNKYVQVCQHKVCELGVRIPEEHELVRAAIISYRVAPVRVAFLTDALLCLGDDAAEQACLILVGGKEFRG